MSPCPICGDPAGLAPADWEELLSDRPTKRSCEKCGAVFQENPDGELLALDE